MKARVLTRQGVEGVEVFKVLNHPRFVYTFGERLVRSRRSRRCREGVDTFGPVQHVYTVYTDRPDQVVCLVTRVVTHPTAAIRSRCVLISPELRLRTCCASMRGVTQSLCRTRTP